MIHVKIFEKILSGGLEVSFSIAFINYWFSIKLAELQWEVINMFIVNFNGKLSICLLSITMGSNPYVYCQLNGSIC